MGKGVGQRCLHHWRKDTSSNINKQIWLDSIDSQDKTYLVAIWEFYEDENLAYEQENNLIYIMGREGIDEKGTLLNLQINNDTHYRTPTKTTDMFIEESIAIHGLKKYDYSQSVYVDALTPIVIKCIKCKTVFEHYPNEHKKTQNCPNCAIYKNKGTLHFINSCKEMHGDVYDYSKVEYINAQEKVLIICKVHGGFWQKANHHKRGHGCSKCSGNCKKG